MTATTPTAFVPVGHNLSFGGVLWSEWTKLRSIRSTWWCYGVLFVLTVALGAQMASSLSFTGVDGDPTREAMQALAVYSVTTSTDFTAMIVAVVGVLFFAGEYGAGMIGSTLTAVPKRIAVIVGKALVFAVVTFVVSALAFAVTIPISIGLLSGSGIEVDLGDADYWLAMLGSVSYLTLVGLIAFMIGAILRSTAGGIAVSLGLAFAAPLVLGLIGGSSPQVWLQNVQAILPSSLGRVLFAHPGQQAFISPGVPIEQPAAGLWMLEPWQGGLLLVAWVVALFVIAATLLKRRDA
jgi:ABC-2 type transport system permease protein